MRYRSTGLILCLFLLLLLDSTAAQSATAREVQILSGSSSRGAFGYSVAIDGDTAVIGARNVSRWYGAAYVYTRLGDAGWVRQSALTRPDGAILDMYGQSVALDGNTAVVGSPRDEYPPRTNAGSAYVFTRGDDGVWTVQQKLLASDARGHDWFGTSVAIHGDTVVVGTPRDDDHGANSGSAYVFTRDADGLWTQTQKLVPSDGAAWDFFGEEVAIHGPTVIVGAEWDDDRAEDSGSAYVYEADSGGFFVEREKLGASPGHAGDAFGASISIHGNVAVIGAYGSTHVFVRDTGGWTEEDSIARGSVVSVDGEVLMIGAGESASLVGRTAAGRWSEMQRLSASDGELGDRFGFSVAIDGYTALVGAPFDDNLAGTNAGSVYVFSLAPHPAIALLNALVAQVVSLNIQHGVENALDAKLDTAIQALDDVNQANDQAAINALGAFINHVEAQRGVYISDGDADLLIASAQEIIDLLLS